jgi:hypothetical protein
MKIGKGQLAKWKSKISLKIENGKFQGFNS